jgi:hypothetical protein
VSSTIELSLGNALSLEVKKPQGLRFKFAIAGASKRPYTTVKTGTGRSLSEALDAKAGYIPYACTPAVVPIVQPSPAKGDWLIALEK